MPLFEGKRLPAKIGRLFDVFDYRCLRLCFVYCSTSAD